MVKIMDVSEQCPFHNMWEITRKSRVTRLIALGHAAALRVARDFIDRRLAAIERADAPRKTVTVPVAGETPPHE
jgi:hypothetical protein